MTEIAAELPGTLMRWMTTKGRQRHLNTCKNSHSA